MEREIERAKVELRGRMRGRLREVDGVVRERWSAAIRGQVRAGGGGGVWIGFMPLGDEPDVLPLWRERWAGGEAVVLPRVTGVGLELHVVRGEGELVRGALGVWEPGAEVPRWAGGKAVCWVPGLAFDRGGGRLGRGGGYYDRLLGSLERGAVRVVGVFFSLQEVGAVPRLPHDQTLDGVVTEAGWVRLGFEGAGRSG